MKRITLIACAFLIAPVWLRSQSFSIPPKDSPDLAWWRESMQTHDERMAWWREARFGMFVHWGVYSSLGNEYHGRKGGTYAEHIQRVLKIPIPEYRNEVAGRFNPTNFNADEWIRTAKQAGMGYFVITSKHHDGFAMWPSLVSAYNLTNCTLFKRDPLGELRDACRKHGLKFGFYYSQAFDWGEENGAGNDWDYQNPGGDKLIGGRNWWETRPDLLPPRRRYVDEKAIPQLQELIKLYDPDILWFDTSGKLPPSENLRIMKAVRAASSRVVINGRLVGGLGDYVSTTDRPAEFAPHEGDWEGIPTTNESYGWNKFDHSHKPASHFIQLLAKAASRGGNLLMNVGPMGNGQMEPEDVAILQGIGTWWKTNGESIRGTTRTPLAVQSWGESTRNGRTLYLHVFEWPSDGRLVIGGLKSDATNARLLADSSKSLVLKRVDPLDLSIAGLPSTAPDSVDTVIAIESAGKIETDDRRLLQPLFRTEALSVFDAQLKGKGLKFGPGKVRDAHVTGWSSSGQSITWSVRLEQPATFEVGITYDADTDAAGAPFTLSFSSQALTGHVTAGSMQTNLLGRVSLKAGEFPITLASSSDRDSDLMRPRAVVLNRSGD